MTICVQNVIFSSIEEEKRFFHQVLEAKQVERLHYGKIVHFDPVDQILHGQAHPFHVAINEALDITFIPFIEGSEVDMTSKVGLLEIAVQGVMKRFSQYLGKNPWESSYSDNNQSDEQRTEQLAAQAEECLLFLDKLDTAFRYKIYVRIMDCLSDLLVNSLRLKGNLEWLEHFQEALYLFATKGKKQPLPFESAEEVIRGKPSLSFLHLIWEKIENGALPILREQVEQETIAIHWNQNTFKTCFERVLYDKISAIHMPPCYHLNLFNALIEPLGRYLNAQEVEQEVSQEEITALRARLDQDPDWCELLS